MRKKQLATRINFNEEHKDEGNTSDGDGQWLQPLMTEEIKDNVTDSLNDNAVTDPVYKFDSSGTAVLEDGTVVVEPVPADIPATPTSVDCQKGIRNSISTSNLPMVKCTVCGMMMDPGISMISIHPVLQVIRCQACAKFYRKQDFAKDSDGKDENCRWCADGGDLICCDNCSNAFCKRCIKRNLGRSALSSIESLDESSVWRCYICDPSPIQPLQKMCYEILVKADEFKASRRRRSERAYTSWRNRSNTSVKASEVTPGVTENQTGSSTGGGGATSINNNSAETLKALTSIFSQLSQSVCEPNKTDFSELPEMGNLLQLMGQSMTNIPPNTAVPATLQPPRLPGWSVNNTTVGSDGRPTVLERCLTGNTQPKLLTANSPIVTAVTPTVSANSEIAAILNQITSVDESNIRIALKAARRCIETFSADIHRLELMAERATTTADFGRVVRSFHSIYRFHLFARLSNLSARMREEIPRMPDKLRSLNSSHRQNSFFRQPGSNQPIATPTSTAPLTIDLTDDTDAGRETNETPQSNPSIINTTTTTTVLSRSMPSTNNNNKTAGFPSSKLSKSRRNNPAKDRQTVTKDTVQPPSDPVPAADVRSRLNPNASSSLPSQSTPAISICSSKAELNTNPSSLAPHPSDDDSRDSVTKTSVSETPRCASSESGLENPESTVMNSSKSYPNMPISSDQPTTGRNDVDDQDDDNLDDDDDINWKLDMLAHLSQSETSGMAFNADTVIEANASKSSSPDRLLYVQSSGQRSDIRDQLAGDEVVCLKEKPQFGNPPSGTSKTAVNTTISSSSRSNQSEHTVTASRSSRRKSPLRARFDSQSESDVDLASLEASVSSLERRCGNVEKIGDRQTRSNKTRPTSKRAGRDDKQSEEKTNQSAVDVDAAGIGTEQSRETDQGGKCDSLNTPKVILPNGTEIKSIINPSETRRQTRFIRSIAPPDASSTSEEDADSDVSSGVDGNIQPSVFPEVARNDLLREELLTQADAQYQTDLAYRDRLLRDSSEDELRPQENDTSDGATSPAQEPEATVASKAKGKQNKPEHTSNNKSVKSSRHSLLKSLMQRVWSSSEDESKGKRTKNDPKSSGKEYKQDDRTDEEINADEDDVKPVRRRGRPRKAPESNLSTDEDGNAGEDDAKPVRKRGRPRKVPKSNPSTDDDENADEDTVKPVRKRGRPRKVPDSNQSTDDSSQEVDGSGDSLAHSRVRPGSSKTKSKFSSSDSESEEDTDYDLSRRRQARTKKSTIEPSRKRRRRVQMDDAGSEVDEDEDDDDVEMLEANDAVERSRDSSGREDGSADEDGKVKGRRKIRKIYAKAKLSETTKTAEAVERERRKRLAERQKLYNDCLIQEGAGIDVVTKKLVLEKSADGSKDLIEVHPDILKHLKPHQVEAVRFLWDCVIDSVQEQNTPSDQTRGAILAHCMGLGKTLSVIAFLHTLFTYPDLLRVRTCLVICPVNTLLNWKHEWEMWLPQDDPLDVYELSIKADNRQRVSVLKHWHTEGGVMLLGYDMFRNFVVRIAKRARSKVMKETVAKALLDPGPDIVVCDEGHVLKNCKSALSKAMSEVRTLKRIVLTGTPLQNNLTEYHAMVNFVKPNLLGTAKEFNNRFANPIKNGQHSNSTQLDVQIMKKRAHVLYKTLDGCVQRKDYAALTKYLPPRYEYVIMCRLSTVQQDLYRLFLQHRSERALGSAGDDDTGINRRKTLFTDQQTLYRVWTHPFLLRSHETREARKMLLNDDEDDFIDDDEEGSSSTSSSESALVIESSDSSKDNNEPDDEAEVMPTTSSTRTRKNRRRSQRGPRTRSSHLDDLVCLNSGSETEAQNGTEDSDTHDDSGDGRPLGARDTWWSPHYRDEYDWDVAVGAKLDVLLRLLKKSCDIGDKLIIFTQSLLSLDLLEKFLGELHRQWMSSQCLSASKSDKTLDDRNLNGRPDLSAYFSDMGRNSWVRGVDYERMDGSTNAIVRKDLQNRFNRVSNTQLRLFLISTRAGGLGINLIAANRIILFDACWNPSHDIQSIFRSYRFGQKKPVYIYRLIAQGTMEEKIYDRQVTKQSLSLRVIDEQQIDRHFSNADLQALYTFEPDVWDPASADQRPTPKLPKDRLLADMLSEFPDLIVNYHEHDSLLEHREDEGLTEEQRQEAWREYEEEKMYGMSLAQHQRMIQQQQEMQARMQRIQQQHQLIQQQQQQARSVGTPAVPSWIRAMMGTVPFNPFYPALRSGVPVPIEPNINNIIADVDNPATSTSSDAGKQQRTAGLDQQSNGQVYYELFDYFRSQLLSARPSLSADPEQLKRLIMGNMMDHLIRTKAITPGVPAPPPPSNAPAAANPSGPSG